MTHISVIKIVCHGGFPIALIPSQVDSPSYFFVQTSPTIQQDITNLSDSIERSRPMPLRTAVSYVHMLGLLHNCPYTNLYTHLYTCLYTHLYISVSIPICISISIPICISVCIPICTPGCIPICISVCIPLCMPVCVPVSVCACLYTGTSLFLSI